MAEAAPTTVTTGATSTPPSASTTITEPAASPTTSAPAPAPTDWTTGFTDETRAYVANKGFKGPQDVLESYRNFEKTMGSKAEHLLKLPENMDTPEGRAVFERLGAPKDAKDYKIDIPKEFGDEKLAQGLRDVAHKYAFTNKQVEGLVNWWNERSGGAIKTAQETANQQGVAQEQSLKKEWGAAYDQNLNLARAGATKYGLDKGKVDALQNALGYDGVMKLLHGFALATGEAPYVSGQNAGGGVLAPSAAVSQIKELSRDPSFAKRLASGDADAKRQWDKLNYQAYGAAQ